MSGSVVNPELVAKMPSPDVYELEYEFWPWGKLIDRVADWLTSNAEIEAHILDYMCGTGYLLAKLAEYRPDLHLTGCDLDRSYVEYARSIRRTLNVVNEDAREFIPNRRYDIILCTAGLHHLPRSAQAEFVRKLASEINDNGILILGEESIREYNSEQSRMQSVLELSFSLVKYVVERSAPHMVIESAFDVMRNDLFEHGEYKSSRKEIDRMLTRYFEIINVEHIWPTNDTEYGDILFFCRKKSVG